MDTVTRTIINTAIKHLNNGAAMATSATHCADEAHARVREGAVDYARQWALRSLAHSVGVFHPDYQAVKTAIEATGWVYKAGWRYDGTGKSVEA
jgi:hypothetical protein